MIGKRALLVLAAVAVLLLQFADCMSALIPDQQTMQCCGGVIPLQEALSGESEDIGIKGAPIRGRAELQANFIWCYKFAGTAENR